MGDYNDEFLFLLIQNQEAYISTMMWRNRAMQEQKGKLEFECY